MIEQLVTNGGDVKIVGGFLKTSYPFMVGEEQFGQLRWEKAPPGLAFYDVENSRYEVRIHRTSRFFGKGSIQVRLGGTEVAELKVNWNKTKGEIITSQGHRFTFKNANHKATLERESNHEKVFTFSRRSADRSRTVTVHPSNIAPDEFLALLAAMSFHFLATDYLGDTAVMTPIASGSF
jgi:hypothetical protein